MRVRRGWLTVFIVVGLVGALVGGALVAKAWLVPTVQAAAIPPATPESTTPPPAPLLTPAQELLATTDDPLACAVTFHTESAEIDPMLQTTGQRYAALPIPQAEGQVFAGWYDSAESAAALTQTSRLNGADLVACDETRERTLFGGWMTTEAASADVANVPILMFHQFTDKPDGEDNWLKGNYFDIGEWEASIKYIADNEFYLPTWDELEAFIDGRLFLPQKSVIVTDDDADVTWITMAVPILDKYEVLATSFVITTGRTDPTPSIWVQQRSHTHDMHSAGDNGKGRIVNWTVEQIKADLETSAQILGAKEVLAYPYGHYDDRSKEGVTAAGFTMAVTTEYGYVTVGSDKLALPRVRMNWGMTAAELPDLIG